MIDFCSPGDVPRPTREQLAAAHDRTIPDVLGPGLDVVFCGINPGLYSGFTGHHFARPGNRFWPALHAAGFTPRLLRPDEQDRLLEFGLGVTNLVARATARADELSAEELRAGGEVLTSTIAKYKPRVLAVVGITAYRTAFAKPKAAMGPQEDEVGGVGVWVLPNPSGLNAHYQLDGLAAEYRLLRESLR
ncbi:G/U mismatch-specific DNA glycosylase [Actinokineospora pegani]|uniref:G/U mismatch-specific DNA glycosylase n=1 Tax=Actinokineospora pegani TaxID=2654637 RepID=UPI0012E9DCFE|nr:G/U mismatch-specific DNA glycosylase [Actinokineospora pegani]